MSIEIVTPPAHVALTTLARLKVDLRISVDDEDAARDTYLSERLCDASLMIESALGRPITRQLVDEDFGGTGRSLALLSITPVAQLTALTHRTGGAVDLSLDAVRVQEPEAGFLWRRNGWPDDAPFDFEITQDLTPQVGEQPWIARYFGGWLTAADDVPGDGLIASGDRFIFPASRVAPMICSGEVLASRGWQNGANNRRFKVLARTDSEIVISGSLTLEVGEGTAAELVVRNLPPELERMVFDTVRSWLHRSDMADANVSSERLGDWSATYTSEVKDGGHVLPATVVKALEAWERVI